MCRGGRREHDVSLVARSLSILHCTFRALSGLSGKYDYHLMAVEGCFRNLAKAETYVHDAPDTHRRHADGLTAHCASTTQIDLTWTPRRQRGYRLSLAVVRSGLHDVRQIATQRALSTATVDWRRVPAQLPRAGIDGSGNLGGYSNVAMRRHSLRTNTGLVAAYSFDEGRKTTTDLSGNGNTYYWRRYWTTKANRRHLDFMDNGLGHHQRLASLHLTTDDFGSLGISTVAPSGWRDLIYKQKTSTCSRASSTYRERPTGPGLRNAGRPSRHLRIAVKPWTHRRRYLRWSNLTLGQWFVVATQAQTFH